MTDDIELRKNFWSQFGKVHNDALTHLINPAFMANMPKWPSLRQSFIIVTRSNGNTILASDGLSEPFENNRDHKVNGFELEFYIETDEKIDNPVKSYQFDILYQISQFAASNRIIRGLLDKYGILTTELYDVRVDKSFQNTEGRVGVILGLTNSIPSKLKLSLSEISIVNVKLLTLSELKYVVANGEQGRKNLKDLFDKSTKTITNLKRESVV